MTAIPVSGINANSFSFPITSVLTTAVEFIVQFMMMKWFFYIEVLTINIE